MAAEPQNLPNRHNAPKIENPVIYVPIRHLYICRGSSTNQPFYAKQTQFPKKSNERKSLFNKGL